MRKKVTVTHPYGHAGFRSVCLYGRFIYYLICGNLTIEFFFSIRADFFPRCCALFLCYCTLVLGTFRPARVLNRLRDLGLMAFPAFIIVVLGIVKVFAAAGIQTNSRRTTATSCRTRTRQEITCHIRPDTFFEFGPRMLTIHHCGPFTGPHNQPISKQGRCFHSSLRINQSSYFIQGNPG